MEYVDLTGFKIIYPIDISMLATVRVQMYIPVAIGHMCRSTRLDLLRAFLFAYDSTVYARFSFL